MPAEGLPVNGYFARKRAENAARGYSVDYKYLAIAFFIEIAVIYTSLQGAWLFADTYARDSRAFTMMMLAPIAYAGVELSRVPLAFALRTQTSRWWKTIFAVLVLCAAAVTVKSLSQLGEIMFRPRLTEVTESATHLADMRAQAAGAALSVKSADAVVEQRREELRATQDRLKTASGAVTGLPAEKCSMVTRRTGEAVTRRRECRADGRQSSLIGELKDAQTARDNASTQFDAASVERAKLSTTAADSRVSDADIAYRKAVMNSQLHSFTAMFFGKEPTQVTDGEIHFFLRWFVFFPAIFASLAATGLALASVTYPRREAKAEAVEIDEAALRAYVLEPLVAEVQSRVLHAAEVERARVAAAAHGSHSTGGEVVTPPPSVNDNPLLKKVAGESQ